MNYYVTRPKEVIVFMCMDITFKVTLQQQVILLNWGPVTTTTKKK